MNQIKNLYNTLYKKYGPQGWWPLLDNKGTNPTKTGSIDGYHPGDYDFPKAENERFEICLGAILTQNTSWPNVEKALKNLKKDNLINPHNMIKENPDRIKELIRPAGYFNQKTKKIFLFIDFYINLNNQTPSREQLLDLWGIGPETADSILLYAYKQPVFIVDTYTRRLLNMQDKPYEEIKHLIESSLEKDYKIYQEFHALIVEHGKR